VLVLAKNMATNKQKKAIKKLVENGGNISKAMREAGYSKKTSKTPKKLTESKAFVELMEKMGLDDKTLTKQHLNLMNSHRLDHMTFPLGPLEEEEKDDDDEDEEEGADSFKEERTKLTDKEIQELLASANCVVRRIVHGEHARHVYFWAPDNKARKDALDMAYKVKGHYAPEKKHVTGALSLSQLFDDSNDEPDDDK